MNWIYCKFKLTTNKNCPESLRGGCQYCKHYLGEIKMIKLSTGVEISEDTVINALKKAGIVVEPKHIFKAGDVAYNENNGKAHNSYDWRFIVTVGGKLSSVDNEGILQGFHQEYFERNNYVYIGRQSDLLRG